MNYFETLDWFPFFPRKKIYCKQKEAYKWVFPKAVFSLYMYILINNLPMQNESTFAS